MEPEQDVPSYMRKQPKPKRLHVVCALCHNQPQVKARVRDRTLIPNTLRKVGSTYIHVGCLPLDAQAGLFKQEKEKRHGR